MARKYHIKMYRLMAKMVMERADTISGIHEGRLHDVHRLKTFRERDTENAELSRGPQGHRSRTLGSPRAERAGEQEAIAKRLAGIDSRVE
jgi:hypothetical protein